MVSTSVLIRPFLSGAAPLGLSYAPLGCLWNLIMHQLVVIDDWLFKELRLMLCT